MQKKYTAMLISAAVLTASMSGYGVYRLIDDLRKPLPQPEAAAASPYGYLIREYQGKIAVFNWGDEEPTQIIDIELQMLPEYDQQELKKGIPIRTEEALTQAIEDYTS